MVSKSENRSWGGVFRALMSLLLACAFLPIARPQAYAADDLAPASADLTAQESEELEGTAYAVRDDATHTLTFLRSTQVMDNKTTLSDSVTLTDRQGSMYTSGTVYTGFEAATYTTQKSVPWSTNTTTGGKNYTKIVFKDTIRPVSTAFWFRPCSSLTEIEGLDKLDTSRVTNMASMFYNCSQLESLDLSSFDTTQVTSMANMFYICSKLESLDLSSFDTTQVSTMTGMFSLCSKLSSLKLGSNFSFAGVDAGLPDPPATGQDANGKYYTGEWACDNTVVSGTLPSLSLMVSYDGAGMAGTWTWAVSDTEPTTDASPYALLFTDGTLVFQRGNDLSHAKTAAATAGVTISNETGLMENGGSSIWSETAYYTHLALPWTSNIDNRADIKRVVFAEESPKLKPLSTANWLHSLSGLEGVYGLGNLDMSSCVTMANMFYGCSALSTLDVNALDTSSVTSMASLFYNCKGLTELNGLDKINTRNVQNMDSMFRACEKLTSIDVSKLDTSKVINMDSMFRECKGLSKIEGTSGFDTGNVTTMAGMFQGCESLEELDLSNWSNSKVADMSTMFQLCYALEGLTLKNFGTAAVQNMSNMFNGCSALESLDVSSFETAQVTTMSDMFNGCSAMTNITLNKSQFDTSKVSNMSRMFANCSKLTDIDTSGFKTQSVDVFVNMFSMCSALKSVDVSSFDVSAATSLNQMFQYCTSLESLDLSSFDTSSNPTMVGMFTVLNSDSRKNLKSLTLGEKLVFGTNAGQSFGDPSSDAPYTGKWALATGDGTAAYTSSELVAQYDGSTMAGEYVWQVDIKDAVIAAVPDQTYAGTAIEPELTVTVGEGEDAIVLVAGEDYTVEYAANTNAGTATATVVPTGRCTNTGEALTADFKILPASLSGATVTTNPASYTYDGTAKTPAVTVKLGSKTLSADDYTVSYSANTAVGTATAAVTGKGNYTGTASGTFTIAAEPEPEPDPVATSAMYRLYNPNSGEHLFTTDKNEFDTLPGIGWKQEGTAWKAPVISSTPVYRLYNPYSGDHHYTMDANEYASLGKIGWQQEGICWYSDDDKGVGLYRLFNPNATVGTHHYTLDENEYNTLGRIGWKQEGTCWYGVK